MGLLGSAWWKKFFRDTFPNCWYYSARQTNNPDANVPNYQQFQIYIEDMMITAHNIIRTVKHKQILESNWENIVPNRAMLFPNLEHFVALFDVEQDVPYSKHPNRKTRNKSPIQPKELELLGQRAFLCRPESDATDEIYSELFGKEVKYPEKPVPYSVFLAKHMDTPTLRRDMVQFATQSMTSSTATAKIPRGLELRIDAGVWTESDAFGDFVDIPVDPPKGKPHDVIVTTYKNNTKLRKVECPIHIHNPGEADLKFVRAILDHLGKNIWITCVDTDIIPILLLWMSQFINPETKNIESKIFVDLGILYSLKYVDESRISEKQAKLLYEAKVPEIVDIVELWRSIHRWMAEKYPHVKNPIEVLCILMIMGGTDYVDKPTDIGAETIWQTFCEGGNNILATCIHVKRQQHQEGQTKKLTNQNCTNTEPLCKYSKNDVILEMNEDDIMDFIKLMYCIRKRLDYDRISFVNDINNKSKSDKTNATQKVIPSHGYTLPDFATISNVYSKSKKQNKDNIVTLNTVQSMIRRITWNIFYWLSCPIFGVGDVLKKDGENKSYYGWSYDSDTNDIILATEVAHHVKRRKRNVSET